jgi:hypothetical protein
LEESGAAKKRFIKMRGLGDVYVFQDDVIIGMVGGIQFRRYPRILMNRFF